MVSRTHLSLNRLSKGAVALLGGLVMTWLGSGGVNAAVTGCRSDPTVTLSNGVSVTMWADMNTVSSNVKVVNYVLHVPAGVSVKSIAYDTSGIPETVQVVADQSGTHYEDVTTAYLDSGSVSMTAYATRQDSTVASKNGNTGTAITLNWCT